MNSQDRKGIALMQAFLILSLSFAISIALDQSYVGVGNALSPAAAAAKARGYSSGIGLNTNGLPATAVTPTGGYPNLYANAKPIKLGGETLATGNSAQLLRSLGHAALVFGLAKLAGGAFGLEDDQSTALGASLAAGVLVYENFAHIEKLFGASKGGFGGLTQFGFAVGIAAVVFIALYKDVDTEVVNFQCLPWEPALGGSSCEECGKDGLPCSEYRCRSLGQACGIVNEGTIEEACVWISPNDVTSPTITPLLEFLEPQGLSYTPLRTRPDGIGTRIEPVGGGCLPAFTDLQFGFETNEVAQCKIDWERVGLDDMRFYVGETNSFLLNHTQNMRLPSPNDDSVDAPVFENDGEFTLFVQCQDANGNKNEDHFVVEYCVDESPDTTAPQIVDTEVVNGRPVQYQISEFDLDIYVNEEASCKWSRDDKPFDDMEHTMACSGSVETINGNPVYPCTATLTGVEDRVENEYFFRCRDDDGNTNVQSFPFTLRGSQPLNILTVSPNQTETIIGSTQTVKVDLEIETDDGSDEGVAVCLYNNSLTQNYVEMFESGSFAHKQTQDLPAGNYDYNFLCVDAGGNTAEASTSFEVEVDTRSPRVVRIYRDTTLKIVTDEDAQCSYSLQDCNFNIDEGIDLEYSNVERQNQLFAPWVEGNKYHIKCVDDFGNQPDPNSCSVIVSPRSFGIVN